MIFENLLSSAHSLVLNDLLDRCSIIQPSIDIETVKTVAISAAKATNAGTPLPEHLMALLDKWYTSLQSGQPDYTVYGNDLYIAELWACWKVYSRTHLLNIQKTKCLPGGSISGAHSGAKKIVDLGCGFAYTTAAIKQIFPNATVYGTNIDGTLQMEVARGMAKDYGFTMGDDPGAVAGETDLVFASEYFEHIDRPIQHLDYIIETLQPSAMLIANAFGTTAIGHFHDYWVYENENFPAVPARQASKIFNQRMKYHGFTNVKTKLWNNRPTYWVKI